MYMASLLIKNADLLPTDVYILLKKCLWTPLRDLIPFSRRVWSQVLKLNYAAKTCNMQ